MRSATAAMVLALRAAQHVLQHVQLLDAVGAGLVRGEGEVGPGRLGGLSQQVDAEALACGALTTQVPATKSPTRRRSRLNSGKKAKTELQAKPSSASQPSTGSTHRADRARKLSGRKISSSRMALRANTASAVSRPPSRAATRRPRIRLPGVAARASARTAMK